MIKPSWLTEYLMLKLIKHILAFISLAVAGGSSGESAGEDVQLGPVAKDEVGKGKQDGQDDRRPEEVDVGVDRQHAVLVEQPRQSFCSALHC